MLRLGDEGGDHGEVHMPGGVGLREPSNVVAHLVPPGIIRVARVGPASGADARPVDNLAGAVANDDDEGLGSVVRVGSGRVGSGVPLHWGSVTNALVTALLTVLRIRFTLPLLAAPLAEPLGVRFPVGIDLGP